MKQITVSGAIILRTNPETHRKEIFATQRGYGDYKDGWEFHLTMHCILCTIVSGELKLLEHEAARWLSKETLHSVDWLPADLLILDKIEEIL